MTVVMVESFVVQPDKHAQFAAALQTIRDYKNANPATFKEMKSKAVFSQLFGGVADRYIELNEFDSMADAEMYLTRIFNDEEFMKRYTKAKLLLVPATYSLEVWKSVT